MIIPFDDGSKIDTDKLNDVDAILSEECKKLHSAFSKYGRQLFLVAEIREKPASQLAEDHSHLIVCFGNQALNPDEMKRKENYALFLSRINNCLLDLTDGQFRVSPVDKQIK